ncbi:family 2 glycosyl transferase [Prauserella marina]|uniref:Glycosyl transferase family 2 n=1 Tax=Prauserella marina TaxID=530584 RepID=A0A222VTF6_9PSEU|nr:glycosyltransferase [Prauserella marina]ASR37217.1 family 2 glycosyl transferase [Prauserella marina]PWV72537.1 glycosyl transferase family 2 [Prauserella marina]SDD77696.1 Glycosyl transferase family 2 [Prauserella marina]
MIAAIGVVIPARDEESTVGACIGAVVRALRRLPPWIEKTVCLVADRCSDNTAEAATAALRGAWAGTVLRSEHTRSVGNVRALGTRRCLSLLRNADPARTLLLSTDADSLVAPDWALAHLGRANEGHHAVAGVAELLDSGELGARALRRYRGVLDDAAGPEGHGNVYGANLGVRADAYLAVGGFAPLPTGEDHDLWGRLGLAGFRRCYDRKARVLTSARVTGRAPEGLAALLDRLSAR